MNFFGINADKSRIKISTHKPIKKEDYLNLSKAELDEEQYYRTGLKPKAEQEFDTNVTGIKYFILKARNGRVMILRKIKDGNYSVFDSKSRVDFTRIKPESYGNIKRIKLTEGDEYEGISANHNSIIQQDVKMEYEDFVYEPEPESDDEMSEIDIKDEVDDYTEGFISRYRKRKGKIKIASYSSFMIYSLISSNVSFIDKFKKRGASDYKISVMV